MPSRDVHEAIAFPASRGDPRAAEIFAASYVSARRRPNIAFPRGHADRLRQRIPGDAAADIPGLSVRLKAKKEIFFRTCEGKVDDRLVDVAQVEHDGAKALIEEIADSDPGDDFYDSRITTLGEAIRCHVMEEEMPGTGSFNLARQADLDPDGLGEVMAEERGLPLALWESDGSPIPDTPSFIITNLGWKDRFRRAGVRGGGVLMRVAYCVRQTPYWS